MAMLLRPKKNCKLKPSQPLPVIQTSSSTQIYQFDGVFNGFSVEIMDSDDMKKIVSMGCFGKGNLSRSYPRFQNQKPEILRNRIFQNRLVRSRNTKNMPQKIVVLPDSSSDDSGDNAEYFTNLKPHYQLDVSQFRENVHLSLEEAFFLFAAVGCLKIKEGDKTLTISEAWNLFKQSDKYFVQNYIVYYYFRSKNWVLKTGIKFGGDFLLYKQGPAFYHASYVVIITVMDEDLKLIESLNRRSTEKINLMGINRLCETTGKELLICELIWPKDVDHKNIAFTDVFLFSVREIAMKRWIATKDREIFY